MRALIAGMLCTLAAAPAAAEVRLTGPETGGTYQLRVMTERKGMSHQVIT